MNLSQLRKMKDGDIVQYVGPAFTQKKLYEIVITGVGRMIYDDNGVGRFLSDRILDFNGTDFVTDSFISVDKK